jgi:hypothetical protein
MATLARQEVLHPELWCRRQPMSHMCPTFWSRIRLFNGVRPRARRERPSRRGHTLATPSQTRTADTRQTIRLTRHQRPETVLHRHTPRPLPSEVPPLARSRQQPRTTLRHRHHPALLQGQHQLHLQRIRLGAPLIMASASPSCRLRHHPLIRHPPLLPPTHETLVAPQGITIHFHRLETQLSIWGVRKKPKASWHTSLRVCGTTGRMVLMRSRMRGEIGWGGPRNMSTGVVSGLYWSV